MFKSMGKKKLLTLVAVMTVAVTVMGSFALWDTLTADSTSTAAQLRNPVTVTGAQFNATAAGEVGAQPTLSGSAVFTLTEYNETTMTFTATPVIMDGATDVTAKFDLGTVTPAYDEANKKMTCAVTATPKSDLTSAEVTALAGKDLTIKVTGTIAKK